MREARRRAASAPIAVALDAARRCAAGNRAAPRSSASACRPTKLVAKSCAPSSAISSGAASPTGAQIERRLGRRAGRRPDALHVPAAAAERQMDAELPQRRRHGVDLPGRGSAARACSRRAPARRGSAPARDSRGSPGSRIGPRSQGDRSAVSGMAGIDALIITRATEDAARASIRARRGGANAGARAHGCAIFGAFAFDRARLSP